jgi:hypothetical protein
MAGALLVPVVWFLVGPWDLSTVSADGHSMDESSGMVRVIAVLAVVDLIAAVGRWRGWLTPAATTVGAGVVWTALAFAVGSTSRVSGANMAALWFVVGPVVVAINAVGVFAFDHLVLAHRYRKNDPRRRHD